MRWILLISLVFALTVPLQAPGQAADRADKPRELITSQTATGELPGWKSFLEDAKVQ